MHQAGVVPCFAVFWAVLGLTVGCGSDAVPGQGGTPGEAGGTPAAGSGGIASSGGTPGEAGGTPAAGSGGAASSGITSGGGDRGDGGGGAGAGGATGAGGTADGDCAAPPAFDPALLARCSGSKALTCSFGGATGNYDVTVLVGGKSVVTAESRRFFWEGSPADDPQCVRFTVNVRKPEGQPIQGGDPGIDGLNLWIGGEAPDLQGVSVAPADSSTVVVYLAGDSTVCDQDPQLNLQPRARFTGWGQRLPAFFGPGISVTNYADSGEGTAAFRTDGGALWDRISRGLKAGDYVLVQLGHNDKSTPAATYRSRIEGIVDATKSARANPVLVSPMVRNNGEPLERQHIYGDLNVRQVLLQISRDKGIPFIDLMATSAEWVGSIGRAEARAFYVDGDATHSNEEGARVFAELVVEGIRAQVPELAARLRARR
ncbi:GDSL-type esterase/lipase family protein [Sorangium atrum]|uniref:GDSL-type esterase/lipase family protein n=1 Tax=Sorangium atrum TaxID=2995308 RepID=A0ABT5CB64_9BACT|nr:SGNH/GDSL hydrolase family protein [Sorangium aterium]MDC0683024.1 GDSL-type esterase/lipase family protein [Sorangium aterium]